MDEHNFNHKTNSPSAATRVRINTTHKLVEIIVATWHYCSFFTTSLLLL